MMTIFLCFKFMINHHTSCFPLLKSKDCFFSLKNLFIHVKKRPRSLNFPIDPIFFRSVFFHILLCLFPEFQPFSRSVIKYSNPSDNATTPSFTNNPFLPLWINSLTAGQDWKAITANRALIASVIAKGNPSKELGKAKISAFYTHQLHFPHFLAKILAIQDDTL